MSVSQRLMGGLSAKGRVVKQDRAEAGRVGRATGEDDVPFIQTSQTGRAGDRGTPAGDLPGSATGQALRPAGLRRYMYGRYS